MFSKLKLQIVLGVLVVAIGIFVSRYLNNHSFVSNKFIKQKTDSISTLKVEIKTLGILVYSIQQDLDICNANKPNRETVISQLTKERDEARAHIPAPRTRDTKGRYIKS